MSGPRATLINPMARHLEAIGGPIRAAHAEGVYLHDDTGRSWIDCETGSGVFSLGHRSSDLRPDFDRALREMDLGNHHLISEHRGKLAYFISTMLLHEADGVGLRNVHGRVSDAVGLHPTEFPDPPAVVVFNVSSSECVDSAVKLARGATGKDTIICAANAYHGSTGYALAASAPIFSGSLPVGPPGFLRVPYGSADAIADMLRQRRDVAAVLLEPIAVEAGCIVPSHDFIRNVFETCRERNTLLILDESVSGLGRTGNLSSWARDAAIPDILIMGRALGGGIYPLYATCHRKEIDNFYVKNPFVHISTFGGGEVGCSVAQQSLGALGEPALLTNAIDRGEQFRSECSAILRKSGGSIRDVRGKGLLNAVELCDEDTARHMQRALFDRGVLCRPAVLAPNSLLFIPPLTITEREMDSVTKSFSDAVLAVGKYAS